MYSLNHHSLFTSVKDLDNEAIEEEEEAHGRGSTSQSRKKLAKEHKDQLQKLKEKDPEFYQFLQEHDEELLQFNDLDIEEDDPDLDGAEMQVDEETDSHDVAEKEEKSSKGAITIAMVDSWAKLALDGKIGALRSLMKAFRIACHYGDDSLDDSSVKFTVMSSSVFNKIMSLVLSEMDGILRKLLGLPASGGKKETITNLMSTRKWKNYSHLVKSYLGNALHVLNQMTDTDMISFTLRRIKYSSVLLGAFPNLLRKYMKVVLHFWGTGGSSLPVVCLVFLRDLCIRLGHDCLDECFKGIYKAYVLNCPFISASKLKHVQFLQNCVIELLGVDLPIAYQHAFVFIRQLAMILRDAITVKTKESFRKVYEWKFINCLELWTGAVCVYSSEADFRPLAYPLSQIISGVARLVPTARYFPLRLRCVRMLNRIAASTGNFIPVSVLLLDMLEMKELNRRPTGGVGKAVDLSTALKVSKPTLKTRAFQEACVFSVVEELAEHLAQWSYSVAFFELSFVPVVRLRNFWKITKIERFRKEMRQLIYQIEANSKFTNEKRMSISFLPNDPANTSFLEDEKKSGVSPLSKYIKTLRQRAQMQKESLEESSVLVGEKSSIFAKKVSKNNEEEDEDDDDGENEKGDVIFNSSWLPGGDSRTEAPKEKKKTKKRKAEQRQDMDEDVVEDLVLSSEEDSLSSSDTDEDEKPQSQKQKPSKKLLKKKSRPRKKKKKMTMSADDAKAVALKQQNFNPKPSGNLSKKSVRSQKRKRKQRQTD